ncbi:hypothetical protein B9Z55_009991 [Caenorhabditis nigoni]|uniref:Uncharacterized protein n=1 Tax=Caenorhabditis nigoni TaxID=1611254 RepID=A0A2G5UU67_9PELO|nr:hypothetical protein B9Z55_009991 [Caenorhabditis nigoni]
MIKNKAYKNIKNIHEIVSRQSDERRNVNLCKFILLTKAKDFFSFSGEVTRVFGRCVLIDRYGVTEGYAQNLAFSNNDKKQMKFRFGAPIPRYGWLANFVDSIQGDENQTSKDRLERGDDGKYTETGLHI